MKKIVLILMPIIIIVISIIIFLNFYKPNNKEVLFLYDGNAYISDFNIYGTSLNIFGHLNYESKDTIEAVYINLKNEKIDVFYTLDYEIVNNILKFKTSDYINKGINLENIINGQYDMILTIAYEDNNKYFTLDNVSNNDFVDYYTLTKNNSNNYIYINFKDNGMRLLSKVKKLPDDIYDFVIDPGHGGKDPGAVGFKVEYEKDHVLEISNLLKEELESKGYKVKLTRDEDVRVEAYGVGSRTAACYETKAKYFLSVHLNSTASSEYVRGVEVYIPNQIKSDFGIELANSIIDNTKSVYSTSDLYKIADGVHNRTYSLNDINMSISKARENGFEPYATLSTETPYYFVLRETGGYMSKAFVDGRDERIKNEYYNSNMGCESYLLELGYIIEENDLYIIKTEKPKFAYAITKAFNEHITFLQNN